MTNAALIQIFQAIVGRCNVLSDPKKTERFRKGFRSGEGEAIAVVRPGILLEQWKVLEACVAADKIVIMQAANTGLTEGSTPKGTYERDVVLINTNRMKQIQPLDDGKQIISFPGSSLFDLEKLLAPLNRQPHSVIGSSCIGASIIGGVCNNSGGSLIERGPSYTELSLFAQLNKRGELVLVNHLGIELGDTPEQILINLEAGTYTPADISTTILKASDSEYSSRVRDVDAATPARFNADKRRLYETSGCAGKLAVFAVRLDTFPKVGAEKTFYIGTNDEGELTDLRRHILTQFEDLPVSAEYMHFEAYDISRDYGKDTVLMIKHLGTDRLPMFFAIKGAVDAYLSKISFLPKNVTDRFMQGLARIWPSVLPKRMSMFRQRYKHHLILKISDAGVDEAEQFLQRFFDERTGDFFACDGEEAQIAALHRFAAAGAAIRYKAIHEDDVEGILALDIALRRDDCSWFEELPDHIEEKLVHRLYYGHFMCHVLHQDYIVKKGVDVDALKQEMLEILDQRGAEYPAEHNVGHIYKAKPDLVDFYKSVDPTNSFNPGLGKTSRCKHYH
ncbi:D-lactate dehydrogenase [Pseudovibrio sp. Tun.PSC04-5.I4]|uniref:D-lactate dehydrogenase n=1 Tax=Pseudovibrio sp. Tun.PSC04-5.I4 TaxID=1798213 RepID=UPI00088090DA|nr:D-lactate dehydrogenase [Pseudovibrio sp. Tun.PSC04-5.I4]SDR45680.1 D-lactate dehydrogenase [Pseudovibrio sp. Tun.PSC04-5.I4]